MVIFAMHPMTLPGPTKSLPLFCQVAAVDGGQGRKRLLVVASWHPKTWVPMNSVYAYNFLMGAWRLGASMPGQCRSFFACATVGRTVYVAGGHDEEKNTLSSALVYGLEADAWTEVPDMAEEHGEPWKSRFVFECNKDPSLETLWCDSRAQATAARPLLLRT
jgi:anti-sigma factor RsiW